MQTDQRRLRKTVDDSLWNFPPHQHPGGDPVSFLVETSYAGWPKGIVQHERQRTPSGMMLLPLHRLCTCRSYSVQLHVA